MAFDINKLQRARSLMSSEAQTKMDNFQGRGLSSINFDAPASALLTEAQLYESGYDLSQIPGYAEQHKPRSINESALPDIIKKSFMEQEINTDCLNPDYQREKNFYEGMEAMIAENEKKQKQVIAEEYIKPSTNGIDYNLIRQIVEECIDKKLNSLNENTIKGIKLKDGKIALTDHQGNVYQAALEYKGNLNEQKNRKRN